MNKKQLNPWWSTEIRNQYNKKRGCLKELNRIMNFDTYNNYKKENAKLKKKIKNDKKKL